MSADNGVYILPSKNECGKMEFRVRDAQAIGNITFEPDYPSDCPVLNRDAVLEYFGESEVFLDERGAMVFAEEIHGDYGWTEYGIVLLEGFEEVPFPQ